MKPDRPRHGKETLSTASVVKLLLCLHAVLEWASAQGYADSNVAHGVVKVASASTKNGDQREERRLPFTVDQVRSLFEKLPPGELRHVTFIGLHTGPGWLRSLDYGGRTGGKKREFSSSTFARMKAGT